MRQRSFLASVGYAVQGIRYAIQTQRNMRIHCFMALLTLCGAVFFQIKKVEWLLVILFIMQVMFAELFNTAMEVLVDMVAPQWREEAKVIKNVAAGAVFLCSLGAVVVGLWVFGPRIVAFIAGIADQV
jgi:diacylglycerol kinase